MLRTREQSALFSLVRWPSVGLFLIGILSCFGASVVWIDAEDFRGDQLLCCSRIGSSDDYEIILLDLQSMEREVLVTNVHSEPVPAWSPDGNRFVFSSEVENYSQLHIFDLSTRHLNRLTHSPYDKRQPSWGPDGKYIVYSRTQVGENVDLFLFDLHQDKELHLTKYRGFMHIVETSRARWPPGGETIAFGADLTPNDNHYGVYMLSFPPKTLPQTNVNDLLHWSTDPTRDDEHFVWSPSGKRFAFVNKAARSQKRGSNILYGEFDSSGETREWGVREQTLGMIQDDGQVFEAAPDWAPDSERIAFHRVTSGDPNVGCKDIFVCNLDWEDYEVGNCIPKNVTQTSKVDEGWPAWRPWGIIGKLLRRIPSVQ